jgi:ADP-ribose pyrophosphatase YjhB (NUDIX family)
VAERETVEETGWRPLGFEQLAAFQPMPGMVDTPHVVLLSRGAEYVGEPTDEEEASIIRWIPLADVPKIIADGLIAGAGSLVGLLQTMAICSR